MGTLILPAYGPIYADTQIVIYTVEKFPSYAPLCRPLWQAARAGTHSVISSELTLLETLVMPLRNSDATLISDYERFLLRSDTHLLPVMQDVLREAARLRATIPGLKTPDALHAATALLHGCTLFVTNDAGFKRIPNLPLVLLDDVLAAP